MVHRVLIIWSWAFDSLANPPIRNQNIETTQ